MPDIILLITAVADGSVGQRARLTQITNKDMFAPTKKNIIRERDIWTLYFIVD